MPYLGGQEVIKISRATMLKLRAGHHTHPLPSGRGVSLGSGKWVSLFVALGLKSEAVSTPAPSTIEAQSSQPSSCPMSESPFLLYK